MEENKSVQNPLGYMYFVFSMAVLVQWAIFMGFFAGDTNFVYGFASLVSFPLYIMGARTLFRNGDSYSANTWCIYGTLFGGIFGVVGILTWFDARYNLGIDPTFMGIPMIVSALIGFPSLIPGRFMPWFEFLTWTLVTVWIFIGGLSYYIPSYGLFTVNVWMCFAVGLFILYLGASELLKMLGLPGFPTGKPLCKFPEE